ncbi:MAG: hypothetical protein AAF762_10210 [Pseudomonadota bacterium]
MRLSRLGSLHQCRLSFMRVLTRRMARDGWRFARPRFEIDRKGVGHAVYTATGPERTYSLVAFAHDLPAEQRSDRVIAEAWDATFALVDGEATDDDIARLSVNVPSQEAGRVSERELTLSRANRSVRLWDHVVSALARGAQPGQAAIDATGYLMRTTAVYGSGKFGAADWDTLADRKELQVPFQAEMLTVYLIRTFVRDLVNHMARAAGGAKAVTLDGDIARRLGIGNSTGLGMAPFLVNHPVLFNNWIAAREQALARVRAVAHAGWEDVAIFRALLRRAVSLVRSWASEHPLQRRRLGDLQTDVLALRAHVANHDFDQDAPWDALFRWAEDNLSEEGQELLASLMMEPYGALIDDLALRMCDTAPAARRIDGAMPVDEVRALIGATFGWARDIDWANRAADARAWYVSAEKLEPRLGERHEEPIAPYEQPLAPARDAARAVQALAGFDGAAPVAHFLLRHPEHRHTVRRAQMSRGAPYAEIRDNTLDGRMLPIDMLRAKLSFFGATRFDPRSDRWVRICMYAGAPYPDELATEDADHWVYPETPQ